MCLSIGINLPKFSDKWQTIMSQQQYNYYVTTVGKQLRHNCWQTITSQLLANNYVTAVGKQLHLTVGKN